MAFFDRTLLRAWTLILGSGAFSLGSLAAEDARVLPQGRSRLSLIHARSGGISESFNEKGEPESITGPFNVDLSSGQLKAFDEAFDALVSVLNGTELHYDSALRDTATRGLTLDSSKPKLGDALSAGRLSIGAEANKIQSGVSFQHGLSDRLSVGFMVPIIQARVDVRQSIIGDNTARDIYQALKGQELSGLGQAGHGLELIQSADIESLQSLLASRGYDRFETWQGSGLGDLILGGRYKYFESRGTEWIHSAQFGVTVPTGRTRSANSLVALDLGQGAWDAQLAHLSNWRPGRSGRWLLSHSVHATHRLPSSRALRVRRSPSDFFPDASTEEELGVRLGDKFWTALGANYQLVPGLGLDAGYEWFWKGRDRYSGSLPGKAYDYLSERTDGYLETLSLGASYNTIQDFLAHRFPAPGELSIYLHMPVRGRNSVIAPYAVAELALFF